MTAGWAPDCRCPECGKRPSIGYHPEEVVRAKRERQAARVTSVRCERCHRFYWIRAADIARASPPTLLLLLDPKTAAALRRAGVTTQDEIEERLRDGTLAELQGVGPSREREIRKALDSTARAMVA